MMFRKLYWVTEQVEADGASKVTGVYTSIHDLVEKGIRWLGERGDGQHFRLSLVKLDSGKAPLGVWTSPEFPSLLHDLQAFVRTHEFTSEECQELFDTLIAFCRAETAQPR
ncbi:MAG: hypothetical protein QY327_08025 [Fimbriimonadaceae bacterium]|uniref:Uncharacterized protein n=1 Tax=Candidatus Nitrosymbiomonas proteolyticus TaxID=2608984 RepID=A0A809R696_9BACT|nr:MAG: hypothetical protein EDM74_07935 [Armatimonadota bacterium]MCK6630843.1 hypothetical protein [Fimbriimonadaceae bacterium]BBO23070.1 conserved hypothetical protein [Candidatus Nitrosymbiomonas proteolyticus]MCL4283553.1 hypothetical protein [Fimbriimonadaceae bacterium]RIJ98021.1 MAG: hypothetical protein DCC46_12035 [Armatimonadota bacterium]